MRDDVIKMADFLHEADRGYRESNWNNHRELLKNNQIEFYYFIKSIKRVKKNKTNSLFCCEMIREFDETWNN